MITEVTFELIKHYWEQNLWDIYTKAGYNIQRVNTTTQENYCYKAIKYLSQEQIEMIIHPTYIAFFHGTNIVGVESGYKTNIDYYRVRGLWVDPRYRDEGIATQLIQWFEDRCKEKYMWTIPRESAVGFYTKYGFKITGKAAKTPYGQNYFAVKEIK